MLLSYRPLVWFWGSVAWVIVAGGSMLQLLGPPSHTPRVSAAPVAAPPPPAPPSAASARRVAPALPTVAASAAVEAAILPVAPASTPPGRERSRAPARKIPVVAKGPRIRSDGEDAAPGERGASLPDAVPPTLHEQAIGSGHATGYIGVFTTGTDGTRTFRAMP